MPRFDFTNRHGQTLSGRLELPTGRPAHYAIFAHCFTCSKNIRAASQIARSLAERGIAVLRFDFTGLGNSEGDFSNSSFSSNVTDLIDAAAALRADHQAPSLLAGHSLGGAAAIMAAHQIPEVRAVATIGAPSEPTHVQHLFGDAVATIHEDGAAQIELGGREFTIEKHFLEDLHNHRVTGSLPELGLPLIIFHSPVDRVVSIDHARKLYEAARHPKSFVSLDDADHMLGRAEDTDYVARTLAAWASRYLPKSPDAPQPTDQKEPMRELAPGQVEVIDRNHGLTQDVRTSAHAFHADEPAGVGGNNLGPSPYELLLSALGSCTSMTLRMYARRKNLNVRKIEVLLEHDRIHAKDCDTCEEQAAKIDRIRRTIWLDGELTEQQRNRMLEIADLCPVHKTLNNQIQIVTTAAD